MRNYAVARRSEGPNQYKRREWIKLPKTIFFYLLVMPTRCRSKMKHHARTKPRRPQPQQQKITDLVPQRRSIAA
jgi:hypothetical protein